MSELTTPEATPALRASHPQRWAEVVLVTPGGELLGRLPAVATDVAWWQEAAPVVRAVRTCHGLQVTVLRLLRAERDAPPGGRVTYLAEVEPSARAAAQLRCEPCNEVLVEHPLRNPYAKPGGPALDLAWAAQLLAAQGLTPMGAAEQIKTWNLSSVWCIPLREGRAWLKVVPPFFACEGPLIAALARHAGVPRLLGFEPGRSLLADIPGVDGFRATLQERCRMIDLLVRLVGACRPDVPALLALGLPDFRARALSEAIAQSFLRHRAELDVADAQRLQQFIAGLELRWLRLAECGLPDGLVHGDFHSGNVRVAGEHLTLIDWGDAGIGHPLLDGAAFLERVPEDQRSPLREHFRAAWQRALPGCDPARAERLIAPIAAARQAVIYDQFLDQIEPAEHPYHRRHPLLWWARAARACEAE